MQETKVQKHIKKRLMAISRNPHLTPHEKLDEIDLELDRMMRGVADGTLKQEIEKGSCSNAQTH